MAPAARRHGDRPYSSLRMRICLVTPFAWSLPHEVNDHVAGVAQALRALGHSVTVLAPSSRAADLRRRPALAARPRRAEDLIAVGPAVPVSRRSSMGVPVGARANLTIALARGGYDVVHGFEPGLPSLSYLALRYANTIAVASFFSPERLGYPPGKAQRERLLGRVDALLATSDRDGGGGADALPRRLPRRLARRRHRALPPGAETQADRAGVARGRTGRRARRDPRCSTSFPAGSSPSCGRGRSPAVRTCRAGSRSRPLPARARRGRPRRRPRRRGDLRSRPRGQRAAGARGRRGGRGDRGTAAPRRAAGARRRGRRPARRERRAPRRSSARRPGRRPSSRASPRWRASSTRSTAGSSAGGRVARRDGDPLAGRPWIVCDLHMHTSWSHDCSIPVPDLLDHAESIGLGAIAVTDHNRFGGALEAAELARGRRLTVIPGEEIKTDDQGEVIGLFLQEEIPRGLTFAETIAAIRAQGGLVYLPHPFDRMHAIPKPADAAPAPGGHRRVRGLQRPAHARVLQRRGAPLRAQVRPDDGRRLGRARAARASAPAPCGCARSTGRRSSSSACTAPRSSAGRSRSSAQQSLKWVAQAKERVR